MIQTVIHIQKLIVQKDKTMEVHYVSIYYTYSYCDRNLSKKEKNGLRR